MQVLSVFPKLVLPLLILESMDPCPALKSSPLVVPSRLCHHRKVRCQLAHCCPNKIVCLFPVKREVLTSCSCQVVESSDCCVPLWFFSTDYLTSVLTSVKWREKYLLAPGEASFALVPASNILLPSEEGVCKCKVFTSLGWGENKCKLIIIKAKF